MGVRVLLVDNQMLFRQGIRAVLQSEPSIEIIGEAAAANDAIEKTAALHPDLVMMEIILPDGEGIAAIRTIRQRWPRTQVLVLTSCADQESFHKAAEAGAIGYILKDIDDSANLVEAIRSTHTGRRTLSPTVLEHLIEHYFAGTSGDGDWSDVASAPQPRLTQREIDVLAGVAQGLSDKQIAANLFLSESAVKTRLRAIYHKLGLRNRAQAAVFAVESHLLNESGKIQ
jgi:DNA-binding NarL/FixJ family response regulator